MATDKKISELPVASGIIASDVSVIVRDNIDYSFNFSQLIDFVSANAISGAEILFGTITPQNISGKNGDVFFNTNTGAVYKKVSGIWVNSYLLPQNPVTGNSILYDSGEPANEIGNDNDSFIDIDTGIFYKKSNNEWQQVFSIDSGPPGQPGNGILSGTSNPTNATGANGDFYLNTTTLTLFGPKALGVWPPGVTIKGTDANTLLNGSGSPSNSIGLDGDFYLDTDIYTVFGPKLNGDWPEGTSLIFTPSEPAEIDIPEGSLIPFEINYAANYSEYGNNPTLLIDMKIEISKRRVIYDVIVEKNYFESMLSTILIYGHDSGDGITTIDDLVLTIKN